MALIILSLTTVALLTAFGTSVKASVEHRHLANFDAVLASSISTTTSVVQQQYSGVFSTCPAPPGSLAGYPSSAALTQALGLTGYTAAIAASGSQPAVEYLNNGAYTTVCTTGDVGNPQLINVVVTDNSTGLTQNNTVIVDNPIGIQVTGVSGSTANELVFITQPQGATFNTPFATQPVLEVEENGVIVTSDLSPITLTIAVGTGPNGASLSKTCSGQETAGIVTYTGCSLNEVGTGYQLFASEPDPKGTGNLTAASTPFTVYASQLNTPVVTSVVPSTVTAGAVNVTFTGAANAPAGQSYSAKACTDSAMSVNCVVQTNFTSGTDVTGLTPGSSYFVQITAVASSAYLGATSQPGGPGMATIQLTAPGTVALGYGPTAGSLTVSFAGSANAPVGETYTLNACTNTTMTTGCSTNPNFITGTTLTNLSFTPAYAGTTYYVQAIANAATGYLMSPASIQANHADTSQVETPTGFTTSPSPSQAGAIYAAFTETTPHGGTAPSSFTATVCTDAAMSMNCNATANYTSGAQLGGLTPGTTYYVTITAVSTTTGFVSATTAVSPATTATKQLTAPGTPVLTYGPIAGSLTVNFTASANAPAGQTYTIEACTSPAMTGCTPIPNSSSGTTISGLNYTAGNVGTTYYVEVIADASPGYFSATSAQASHADTSVLKTPTLVVASSTTQAGAITATYTEPGGGIAPASFTAMACTNAGMTVACHTFNNYVSGAQMTGLSAGTSYYVTITANSSTTGVLSSVSNVSAATVATVQLAAPGTPVLGYGASAGSLAVTFTASINAAPGQTYTINACTNAGMSLNCVTNANFKSGTNLTGLAYTVGSAGTTYFVEIVANGTPGYFVSNPSGQSSHADTSQVNAPGKPTATTSTTTNGAITVTFADSAGVVPASYTVVLCTNSAMTQNCSNPAAYSSGAQITGLTRGRGAPTYYATITAIGPVGYVDSAPSATSNGATAR